MKALVQRVRGRCHIQSRLDAAHTAIEDSFDGVGLVVLLGWEQKDLAEDLTKREAWICSRVQGLRIFPDADERMNLSLEDYLKAHPSLEGGILWVPQFTLAAKLESGFRPSFTEAMEPGIARTKFEAWVQARQSENKSYSQIFGHFGADMDLSFTNWGPLSLML